MLAQAEKLYSRNRHRIGTRAREAVELTLTQTRSALLDGNTEQVRAAGVRLEQALDLHLGFVRRSRAREYLEIIGIAVTVALLFRAFVVEPFKIPTGSMIPTLQIGDHIFVDKFVYGLHLPFLRAPVVRGRTPERGDVIVFMYPRDPTKDFIKRVIGVPGDVVEVRGQRVLVNGRSLPTCLVGEQRFVDVDALTGSPAPRTGDLFVEFSGETPYLTLYDRDPPARRDRPPYRVGRGELFAMGDNRDNSRDSRQWGAVPIDYVKGRAHWIWWSFGEGGGSRFDRIGHSILGAPDVPMPLRSALTRCIARGPVDSTTDVAALP
ncbi:MAG: signal peptidase I [Deltaproteobacteria bacterium]|nr:signal peptidase I [Deltaproteobacteria bacterium]